MASIHCSGSKLHSCMYRYVFVEYGPMELDINLRVRVHELEKALKEKVS